MLLFEYLTKFNCLNYYTVLDYFFKYIFCIYKLSFLFLTKKNKKVLAHNSIMQCRLIINVSLCTSVWHLEIREGPTKLLYCILFFFVLILFFIFCVLIKHSKEINEISILYKESFGVGLNQRRSEEKGQNNI